MSSEQWPEPLPAEDVVFLQPLLVDDIERLASSLQQSQLPQSQLSQPQPADIAEPSSDEAAEEIEVIADAYTDQATGLSEVEVRIEDASSGQTQS